MKFQYALEQLMRWYGPSDPVHLQHILQAGCTGVVSALHSIPVGEVWPEQSILEYQQHIEKHQLSWTVVESLPVHEDIKTGNGNCLLYTENYKESLRNLAACGIKVVTYNFMPVLDWVRTNVTFPLDNGAEALYFKRSHYSIFDLYILKRPGAGKDYSTKEKESLFKEFNAMSASEIASLKKTMLLSLPGSDIPFTSEQVLELLKNYKEIDRDTLRLHLINFLKAVCPVAEEVGIQLAIHPDDPPFSVLGLPRILNTSEDISHIMTAVPSKANGLCFCTGSFGARPDNDLAAMISEWGSRINFLHLRNTKMDPDGNFYEANHLEGDADMYAIMQQVVRLMKKENRCIPVRPDHGHKMLDDLIKENYPGYSGIGRLKGLAEIRGLEFAVQTHTAET